jgi:DNA processing protein
VFAVPGNIFRSTSAGCHRLLREGAKLVETAQDILEEYGSRSAVPSPISGESGRRPDEGQIHDLSDLEKGIYEKLSAEPVSVEYLVEVLAQPVDRLANALLSLELKGLIRNLPGQRYVANNS